LADEKIPEDNQKSEVESDIPVFKATDGPPNDDMYKDDY
jgi:hypothetical protein